MHFKSLLVLNPNIIFIYAQAEVAATYPKIRYADSQNSLLRAENGYMQEKLSVLSGEIKLKEGFPYYIYTPQPHPLSEFLSLFLMSQNLMLE